MCIRDSVWTDDQASGLAAVQHSNTETDSKALSSCLYSGGFTMGVIRIDNKLVNPKIMGLFITK